MRLISQAAAELGPPPPDMSGQGALKELLAKQPELLDGPLRLAVQRFLVMAPAKKEPAMERVLKLFSSIFAPALCDDEDHGDAPKPPKKSFTSRTLHHP